ncbi:MAG: hypothetical protein CMH57_03730 [Myxococcales bacterium]|nr:hypothetical protein [Myxococcales bacterium]
MTRPPLPHNPATPRRRHLPPGALLGALVLLLLAPAVSAEPLLLVTPPDDPDSPWLASWTAALHDKGHPTTAVGNRPWPQDPDPAALKRATATYDEALNLFLNLDLRGASDTLADARAQYERVLQDHPFSTESYRGALRAGFYRARVMLQANDRRGAHQLITQIITRYPGAEPDPALFPPAFRQLVQTLRGRLRRRGAVTLTVQVNPPDARVAFNGVLLTPDDNGVATLDNIPPSEGTVLAGAPGIGVRDQAVSLRGDQRVTIDLLAPSRALPRAGTPLPPDILSDLADDRQSYALQLSDADEVGLPRDRALYLIEIQTGDLTAVALFAKGQPAPNADDAVANLFDKALRTPGVEVVRVSGAAIAPDKAAAQTLLESLGLSDDVSPPLEGFEGERFASIGLLAGTGLGVATKVSQPGLAPTPLLLRPEIAFPLAESIDVGVAGRVQLTKLALLGEPFIEWRAGVLRLRGGVAVGQITQTITDTDNRDRSTQGLFGPSAGLALQLGVFRVGASALTMVAPDRTAQFDLTAGAVFDL